MLVLSRFAGEKIVINPGPDQIVLTVVDIERGKIRLGIEAPREMSIYREEIAPRPNDPRTAPEQVPDTY